MKYHYLALALAVLCGGVVSAGEGEGDSGFAKEERVEYERKGSGKSVYLLQVPRKNPLAQDAPILIYLHGVGGEEEQGMTPNYGCGSFGRLRRLMDKWVWIYVAPRHRVCENLLADLKTRFGKRDIYLSGASRGGRWAYDEARKCPERYKGVVLLCPAISCSPLTPCGQGIFPDAGLDRIRGGRSEFSCQMPEVVGKT